MNRERKDIAILYLARIADDQHLEKFDRFITSYKTHEAGIAHRIYVALKGHSSRDELKEARDRFAELKPIFLEVADDGYDIGAYISCCRQIDQEAVCFLNTHAEILAPDWLKHLAAHLFRTEVGLVGASGSFESLPLPGLDTSIFPNPHLRTNGFMVRRNLLLNLFGKQVIKSKLDAYAFENGRNSISRRITARGYDVLIVGRNGRAYPPAWWPSSGTFRQGAQDNLLIGDNHSRHYATAPTDEKEMLMRMAWGSLIHSRDLLA